MAAKRRRAPVRIKRVKGASSHAYVTFLMLNDNYLPGALTLAYALRKQRTGADLVCLVTPEISPDARRALGLLYDRVIDVDPIFVPHKRRQQRQDRPYMFTRLNALRLGPDGDLGTAYTKIVLADADVLPLRNYDSLFELDVPAGIINEDKSHFVEVGPDGQYVVPPEVEESGTWKWHRIYGDVCPHGTKIPAEITDRVLHDFDNLGINGSLFVLRPSMDEFKRIQADIQLPSVRRMVGDLWDWPEMQYLTARWSGEWTSIDVRYSGLNGYPSLSVLYGTHFAGLKPWHVYKKSIDCFARYDDYQRWYRAYIELVTQAYPALRQIGRLEWLLGEVQELLEAQR
jgi:glycogenin glucosyltransferase